MTELRWLRNGASEGSLVTWSAGCGKWQANIQALEWWKII